MPLLNQQYEIDTIELAGAQLNLEINANGISNWSGLAGSASQEPAEVSADESFAFNQLIIG